MVGCTTFVNINGLYANHEGRVGECWIEGCTGQDLLGTWFMHIPRMLDAGKYVQCELPEAYERINFQLPLKRASRIGKSFSSM